MSTLFHNISELRTVSEAGTIKDGALLVDGDGVITWVGALNDLPQDLSAGIEKKIDLGGRAVLPGWGDSHTHMIFDGNPHGRRILFGRGYRHHHGSYPQCWA